MKKTAKLFAKLILFLTSMFLILLFISDRIRIQKAQQMSARYFEFDHDTFDVMFFGTSILYRGVYPMNLWNDYGMVSFNLGSGNESVPMSYYLIKDSIKRHHPDLIVLECSYIDYEKKLYKAPYVHYVLDNMPYFNLYRNEMIADLVDEKDLQEYIIPFTAYHERMDTFFQKNTSMINADINFGARITKKLFEGDLFAMNAIDDSFVLPDTAVLYLEKIRKICDENDIPLLLMTMPILSASDQCSQEEYDVRRNAAYALEKYAAEHDLTYLNMLDKFDELGLTISDTADGFHLNVSGAEKYTAFIGDYISAHYSIPDRRNDQNYAFMHEAYKNAEAYNNAY